MGSFVSLGWTDSCVLRCLPPWMSGTALRADRFICLPLSLHLSPVVFQPGCLHLSPFVPSFVSRCLPAWMPSFVFRCLPAWMPGTALRADEFICLPLSPSLDVWHGSGWTGSLVSLCLASATSCWHVCACPSVLNCLGSVLVEL